MSARILIVEDEEPLTMLLRYNLESEGYEVETAARGDDADTRLKESTPDLVVLDWMLPGLSGIELCRRLRARPETRQLPIIMLTARGEESEKVRGLATGADDYIVKPFSVPELLARVRALLRRGTARPSVLEVGDLRVDLLARRAERAGSKLDLTQKEFALLEYLARHAGEVVTRTMISEHVWDMNFDSFSNVIDVYIRYLRRKIDEPFEKKLIHTRRGVGYMLAAAP